MPRVARPWFRFYVEAMRDPKMRRLTPCQRWLWVAILSAARESHRPGFLFIAEDVAMSWDDLSDYAGMKLRDVEQAIDLMHELGMIRWDAMVGTWYVPAWHDRQYETDDTTQRTRKHRSNEDGRNVPTSSVGTSPETEAETDTETPPPSVGPPKRGTRIPDEFEVTADMQDWVAANCPHVNWSFESGAFVDHWKSSSRPNAVKRDWVRAWRNWMREAQRRTGGRRCEGRP